MQINHIDVEINTNQIYDILKNYMAESQNKELESPPPTIQMQNGLSFNIPPSETSKNVNPLLKPVFDCPSS